MSSADTANYLSVAIEQSEIFTESRALLDYEASVASTKRWIASHEKLRRAARSLKTQNAALQEQIIRLNTELLEKK